MLIEMELLARERHESRLREADAVRTQRGLMTLAGNASRANRKLPLPRLRQR